MNEPVFPAGQTAVAESTPQPAARKAAHVIIVGNEKGGSGKTTTTMHLIVSLLRLGFTVGSMDIDARQRSLTRYIENRRQTITNIGQALPLPHHIVVQKSPFQLLAEAEADERERFLKGLSRIYYSNDFVVIDTPGSDTYLARLAHSFADTIITPINDSFLDLDVLANVDGQTMKVIKPSIYSEMVWEQKLARAKRDGGSIEWIVMRNRLSNIDARNKRHMTSALSELSRRIGFRVAPGFSERVIFREMFLQGLTVLDVLDTSKGSASMSLSHVAARQEVRDLLKTLQIGIIDARITEIRTANDKPEEQPQATADGAEPVTEPAASPETPTAAGKPDTLPAIVAAPVQAMPVNTISITRASTANDSHTSLEAAAS
jgi:chromosome partitioning protein